METRSGWGSLHTSYSVIPAFVKVLTAAALTLLALVPSVCADDGKNPVVFHSQTFVRTRGTPNSYTATFKVPAWVVAPFTMHVVNGDSDGRERVSSATVSLNGAQVFGPSDLNQNVSTLDVAVSPAVGMNTLQVTLDGKPGSEITITIWGTNADQKPPQVTIVTPANGSYINTATPPIDITYSKAAGFDDDRHSECDETTLKITLDGVDRTKLFTIRKGDATATIPTSLALTPGLHTLVATLYNEARIQGSATSRFTVVLNAPTIQIAQPVLGAYLNTTTPAITIQYSASGGINLSSLKVLVNGADLSSLFTKTNTNASATLPPTNALPQGANKIVASIQDLAGNQANASTSFNIDTTSPTISFSHPAANAYFGSSTVAVAVQYADDQAIDPNKLKVTVDGMALAMTASPASATGAASGLANGAHLLVATIRDLAGNAASAQITFYVDTTIPTIHISRPAANAFLNTHSPQVMIDYTDVGGVDLTTLKVLVNGANASSLFTATSTSASAQLTSSFALPDGQNTITAQIANLAGTVGKATSTFLVDTTPPTIAFQAPPARTNSNAPTVTIIYSDATSGVDPNTLVVTLDGADISALVAPGANSATGVLQLNPPLVDGTHVLTATVKDRASNQSAPAALSFVVDTRPPVVSFASPTDNSFINNPTPSITLQYTDVTGTGVDTTSIKILLQQGTNPTTDITTYFQIGPQKATGAIPSTAFLSDGTYVLSAAVNDLVGNTGNARATFVVDTVPPTGTIQAPAANAILKTSSATVTLLYQDDRSGVDTSKLVLTVDGVNQTKVLTMGPTQAMGTLPALPDGVHTIQLTVFDRSSNSGGVISQTFETDTTPPTIAVSALPPPNAAGWNNTNVVVTFTCGDATSGIANCPPSQTVTPEGANQIILGTATDNAGNTATTSVTLNIDKTPPTLRITSPANGARVATAAVTVTGSVADGLSGLSAVTCNGVAVNLQGGSFSCPLTLNIGPNTITVQAVDIAGNMAQQTETVTFTPQSPVITLVSPSTGQQGQQGLSVGITAQYTHFVQGVSTASFGAGITVTSLTVNSSTSATAVVNIDPAAATGARNVTVTTGAEVVTQTNGFTVTNGTPVLTTVNPNTGQQGQTNESVSLTGQFTHWVQGTTIAAFGAGITVVSLGVNSLTSATAVLNIDLAAVTGPRNVTITTNAEVAMLSNGFTVALLNHPPQITSTPPTTQTWAKLSPSGTLPYGRAPQDGNGQAYDAANDRLIVFGGFGGAGAFNDVWVLANATGLHGAPNWLQILPTTSGPDPRCQESVVYVPSSNRLIVQGGRSQCLNLPAEPDTWVLTNANGLGGTSSWIRLPDIPVHRYGHATVYDSNSDRMIIYGGVGGLNVGDLGDVWVLINADGIGTPSWSQLSPIGTPPSTRESSAAVYDPATNRMTVFGGLHRVNNTAPPYVNLNEVWVLTNANGLGGTPQWIALTPSGTPPAGRFSHSLVYNSAANQALLFGGLQQNTTTNTETSFNDLWILTNANGTGGTSQWTPVAPIGGPPLGRFYHSVGYSATSGQMVVAMGRYSQGAPFGPGTDTYLNDVWVLSPLASVTAGQTFTYPVAATDPDVGDVLTFSLDTAPTGMRIDPATGLIQWTPTPSQTGLNTVTVRVRDQGGLFNTQAFSITVMPILVSAAPNSGVQGGSLSIVVAGHNTNFAQGTTLLSFGPGISVGGGIPGDFGPVSVTNSSTATASVSISGNAGLGSRIVSVQTGLESASLINGFAVQAPPATIRSVSPSSGQQGQQSLSVSITGQSTNWVQGTTQASFSTGITVVSTTVNTPTSATAVIDIDPAAAVGGYNVSLTTGSEIETLVSGFNVTTPTPIPTITTISPNSGQQGQQNLSVSITGQFTNFVQGPTTASFGAGTTVALLTVNSPTSATASLNIDLAAAVGARNVTLTTGTEIATLVNGFTVQLNPNQPPVVSAHAGCSSTISMLPAQMTFTEFASPSVETNPGDLVQGSDCNIWFAEPSANKIGRITPSGTIAEFLIPTPNSYLIGITSGPDGNVWFTESHAPNIGRITPSGAITEFPVTGGVEPVRITTGPDGNLWFAAEDRVCATKSVIDRMTIAGVITEFPLRSTACPGTPIVGPDGAIWFTEHSGGIGRITTTGAITEFSIPTPSSIPSGLTVGPDGNLWFTEEGGNQIGRITPTGVVSEFPLPTKNGFPSSITAGRDGNLWFLEYHANKIAQITPTGLITEFSLPAGGVAPDWIVGSADGNLWFTFVLGTNFGIGKFNPTTGVGFATVSGTVTDDGLPVGAVLSTTWNLVTGPGPVTFSNPTLSFADVAGQTDSVTTEATFTAPGTYVLSLSASDSQLTGTANVTVTVNPTPTPSIVSVSPNSGLQGQQNLSVILTGQNTSWLQGTTVASFGPGILVASLTVSSPTSATAVVNISSTASIGSQTVTMTTGSKMETLANGFSVLAAPVASLSSVSPNSGQQGQQNLSVSITGQNTNFVQGTTAASFGAGIAVVSLTVNSPTSATALVNIDPAAAVGARDVTVTTSSEIVSLAGGFNVLTGNQAPVVSANAGCSSTISMLPPQMTFTEFASSHAGTNFYDMTAGPDCNLWFAESGLNIVSRISPAGVFTDFSIPTASSFPLSIVPGPDGNLWFTEAHAGNIGRITPAGVITEFPVNTASQPIRIVSGPDGNLWFTDQGTNAIGRMTTSGVVTEFIVPTAKANPNAPAVGPDGAIWFTESSSTLPGYPPAAIGRVTTTGQFTEFPIPTPFGVPVGITVGPDGNLWFTEEVSNQIGRITPSGVVTEFPIPTAGGYPGGITAGPDGNLWFAEVHGNKIGRITTAGVIAEFPLPSGVTVPSYIVSGPGGDLWFDVAVNGNYGVASLNPLTSVAVAGLSGTVADDGLPVGASLTTTWNLVSGPGPVTFSKPTATFPDVAGHLNPVSTQVTFTVPGSYALTLTASDSQLTTSANVSITVNPPSGSSLVSITPSSSQQGQQNLSLSLAGQLTNWVQGTTVANFGPGIAVASLTVSSPTSATAVVNISSTAVIGSQTVTMTTGSEVETLANGFAVIAAPVPSLSSVSPNSGQQGQGGPVTIVGQNTHFAQGISQVDFGPGIAVSGVTVSCPTCLNAQLLIAPTATPGPRTVTVTTGTEVAILTNGFTILPGTPILTSLVPAGGQQGQTLSVSITGQFTHFTQGTTQVSLGAGITVSSINVSNPTALTAQLVIDPAATVGTRTLTVTTGTEVVSVPNVFTVQQTTPVLFSLNPGGGQQGQSALSVAITGLNTHFVQGTSQITFGAGVIVTSLTVNSPTTATAVVNIDPAATIGTRTVTLTTGTEVASFNNGFTIVAGTPAILSLNPGGSQQGRQNLSVALVGQFTSWAQGTTTANFGSGVSVVSLTVSSFTAATAVVSIDPAAATGPRTVTMTTGSEVETFTNGFTVFAGTPVLLTANPSRGQQGQQGLSVSITGQFTHFVQGTTAASFGAGITIASLTMNSATNATALLNIDPAAAVGARDVTLTTGAEVVTLTSGFTVTNGTVVLTRISPNAGQQGQQNLTLTITGAFTHFAQGTTTASFGAGTTVASVTVNSTTSATVALNIDPAAIPGARDVTITTGTEVVTLTGGFTVTPGTPVLQQVSPNSGQQGQQNLSVIISGTFTHFVQGTTTANFGLGITVASLTGNSSTSATAVLDIDPTAVPGARNVTLSTGSEVVTLNNGFTVVQASSGPKIISLSPNSALQGQAIQVTITAQNTHFLQGTTQVNFGPQISVGAGPSGGYGPVQVTSPTTAVAQISVPNNAVLGLRTVVARTGSEQADIINGFATTGAPYISSLSPYHAQPGQTISVTITGIFTNFQQGVTQANFGPGISVGGGALGGPGPVTVASPSTATALITIDSAATPGLRTPVTVTTGAEQATFLNSGFLVLGPVTAPGPIVSITSPTEGSEVTAPTAVTGTVTSPNLSNWTLEYEASGSTIFTQFASGTASTVSGTLDPTLMLNGIAQVRLTGVDQSGQTSSAIVDVVVTRNTKVGNFTLSFNDLTITVAGIPIQIIRTYDSRNKSSGDFGFGWSLDIQTTKVDVNGVLGNNWTGTTTGGAFPTYCVQPNKNYVVSVRAPGGTVYQFAPTLSGGGCQQLAPPSTLNMAFTPIGATPQNASLTAANSTGLFVNASFPGQAQLVDLSTSLPFDPDQLTLTLPTGQQLQVSRTFGVQSIKDTNGNTLTITANGITSSAGKGVSFARDAQKRITTITDPSGKIITYAYDPNGDLATFTDQMNNISTFTYDGLHNLLSFKDPRGIQPIRNVYDNSGRLIQQIDAFSHVINFTHDLGARTETVTDFLGNPTTYVYDADGNIISTTDALGNVTTATFDAHDNKLSETNALGKISTYTYDANNNRLTATDPLSHTTTYTYNSRNQVLTITDALSRVTTNTYDSNENLLSTKDPAGNSTSYAYNSQGLRISMTDALGGISGYQYDASGNLTQQTDPLGNVTSYTYDGNGNKLSQTKTRTTASGPQTLVTSYQYDGQNRLTTTTYTDGSTAQIQYNAIGKQSVTIDQLGRQTSYQYDLMGRLTQTTFPDGTTETSAYDAQGNRIASTDRAGRTTTFVYDALKRLTGMTYADGATTSTAYDGIGEVTAVTDARGNQTTYQYDGAGRRTSVIDALSHSTSFGYDSVGNQVSMTDANGNTMQYQYDALNRRTNTVYQDTTTDSVAYDALGRTISKTDEAGQVTQFQYDKLGRLTQVTDALSQVTKYAYDEVGNRISQTDANTHTTTFAYDKLGRRTQRTLPLGMSETMSYDAAGNLVSKTDFNGKTTTYAYDLSNRLTSKTPDPSFAAPTISFAYTSTGQRQTMADVSGTTSYSYDLRNRLTQKATPQGTLSYAYDSSGNLLSIQSSNTGGTSVAYTYDALNRLSTVQDNRSGAATTTYSYDNDGNMQGYAYPNGIQTAYSYNTLNRLTNVAISKGAALASYAYQLGPAGNRTQVTELNGRQVGYTYDALYRLTGETISGSTINGVIGYQYDPVGNRLQRTSTVAPVPAATYSYDANDRLTADTYDADGNTTASSGSTYAYDFENRLISQNSGAVMIVYDGDGNRVAKTTGGVTTKYLVDDRNLTGYAQVLEETAAGTVQRVYTYGLNRISQNQAAGTSFFGYDGHGNVRFLTDATGAVTDRYDYDAFGNIVSQVGTTPNVYLYSGEQNDPNLGFYYLRARYLNTGTGRFVTADTFAGDPQSPLTLHKYLYASGNPVNQIDPSGRLSIPELTAAVTISEILDRIWITQGVFPAIVVTVEITIYKPGFEARNAAVNLIANTTNPFVIAAAEDLYNTGNNLIALGSHIITLAKDLTDLLSAVDGVNSATKEVALSINDPFAVAGKSTLLLNELLGFFNTANAAFRSLETSLRLSKPNNPAPPSLINNESNGTADALKVFFGTALKILTSGNTSGVVFE